MAPKLASGEGLGCYALTEPGCGSDARRSITRAERDGDGWLLSGSKTFITLGSWAPSRSFRAHGRRRPEGHHVLPRARECRRIRVAPDQGQARAARAGHGGASLDGVRVPDENRLGELDGGFRVAMSALDVGRISLAAGCVGIAQGCLDASVAYARERNAFGRPIAGFQLVQELLAEIAVETDAARLLAWRAAALADAHAAAHARVVGREAVRERGRGARREQRGAGVRRLRLHRRVPGREVPPRRARRDALRGNEPDPEADHRPRAAPARAHSSKAEGPGCPGPSFERSSLRLRSRRGR